MKPSCQVLSELSEACETFVWTASGVRILKLASSLGHIPDSSGLI